MRIVLSAHQQEIEPGVLTHNLEGRRLGVGVLQGTLGYKF
jgi:hypothetical protein